MKIFIKIIILGQVWWLIPVITVTQEAEFRRITETSPGKKLVRCHFYQ
jgi:hypothetical protein